jgi:hypothetical protein
VLPAKILKRVKAGVGTHDHIGVVDGLGMIAGMPPDRRNQELDRLALTVTLSDISKTTHPTNMDLP